MDGPVPGARPGPDLDLWNREALDRLLHDYDTVWPREHARHLDLVERWNALATRARSGPVEHLREYRDLLEEVRRSAGLDTLTEREREAMHDILQTHDAHRKKSRQWSMGISL